MARSLLCSVVPYALGLFLGSFHSSADAADPAAETAALRAQAARFAPVEISVDLSALPKSEVQVLQRLVAASLIMDSLFIEQAYGAAPALALQLAASTKDGLAAERLRAMLLNKGPWLRLDHDAPFMPGIGAKPEQGSFYPLDATKVEIDKWWASLKGQQQREAKGFFTTIRRDPKGKLVAVPYSLEYQGQLQHAAALLSEASALSMQPTLKAFLSARAKAFLSNDYYPSEVAWMELDASIEPTIGPYEVYEDNWFNAKAAFESFITLRDQAESERLAALSAELQGLEDALPIDDRFKNKKLGALAPIRVVNVLISSGDGNRGVQTAAFNLPNDERVVKEKGSKRVMLKNYQQAKFERVLLPISKYALHESLVGRVAFDSFFTFILMHELMHGLGPHHLKVGGKDTTPREQLKETYSAIEEAKADVTGLWAMRRLVDKGVLDKKMLGTMYVTYLASAFRSVRFGLNEAHGKATAIQVNSLLDAGAFTVNKDGQFAIADDKIEAAVRDLAASLLVIEGEGNYAGAQKLLQEKGNMRPEVQAVLNKLEQVPVDIAPNFVTAQKLLAERHGGIE